MPVSYTHLDVYKRQILRYDSGKALLTLERDCAGVEHPGGSFALFDLFFAAGGGTRPAAHPCSGTAYPR